MALSNDRQNRTVELQILDLLQEHIVGAQYTATAYGTEITNTQAALLNELARREAPRIEELHRVLGIHASTISRTFAQLNQMGLVHSSRGTVDQRRIVHRCTAKGLEFVSFMWRTIQGLIEKRTQRFSREERETLEEFLDVFAGSDAQDRIVPLPNESKLAILFRAMTYDHGVVSGNYVGSGYSATDWVILSEIYYNRRSPGDLARLMLAPRSTISIRLKSLQDHSLLSTKRNLHDKRTRTLTLTAKGVTALAKIERCAERLFRKHLIKLSPVEVAQGIKLFTRYVRALYQAHTADIRIERVKDSEVPALRSSAWMALSAMGPQYPLSGFLLHERNVLARLVSDAASPAILEFERVGATSLRLVNLFTSSGDTHPITTERFISLTEQAFSRKLILDPEWRAYLEYRFLGA